MFTCKLCGLTVDAIPEDAIQCGRLHRFTTGEYHLLRKLVPRTGPRPRKRTPDRESPTGTTPSTPVLNPESEFKPVMGLGARNVLEYVPVIEAVTPPAIEVNVDEAPAGESAMQRAFRLKKVA